MSTKLNMTLLLRRGEFSDSYVLQAGEPGYHTGTKELKIGDGSTDWAHLSIVNQAYFANYKTIQEAISAVETEANVFVDTVAQNENGVITITTKAVDFSAADSRFKKLQTAIEAVATENNVFIEKIAQDAQGVITISTKAVDFSDYRTSAAQDVIDATFKTKQDAYTAEGSTTKTVTKVTQDANGEIEVTYSDIELSKVEDTEAEVPTNNTVVVTKEITVDGLAITEETVEVATAKGVANALDEAKAYADEEIGKLPAQIDYTVTCEDEDVGATDSTPAFKRHVLKQLDGTVCTIDVPKDMVIADGRVENDKLILVLNTGKEIEIAVGDLIEYVTGGVADDGVITVNVDPTTHVVTATIANGTIKAEKLNNDVDTYVDNRVDAKINNLDVDDITGFGAGKTLATLTETDGKIAATFQDIAITESQITDLGDYKTKQTAYSSAGDVKKTVTNVSQNENGEVTVTYGDIDFSHNHDDQYKKLQTAIEKVATEKNVFIEKIGQNANGEISIETKAVDFTGVDTTYAFAPTTNALEFTVTPSEGDAQTVTLVAPTVDTGVMSIEAGKDIVVTPGENGKVTVAHADITDGEGNIVTGTIKDAAHDSATDPSFITGITVANGHVTGATVRNLADVLEAMEFIIDGGSAE